ncbi:L-lactate dehydrogenase [Gossypium arboreum]|uniref:L-lactate dehydrogenase n=1 Tax=Gossypium arboreum TaxID=29729 RepID=A0A0B0P1X4_GOSAR|nr:L-lactate dehydrogenase [Gossypium arboreum]
MACNPAYASAAKGDATLKWRTVFYAKISPPTSRTTIPEANLQDCWSKATSKLTKVRNRKDDTVR